MFSILCNTNNIKIVDVTIKRYLDKYFEEILTDKTDIWPAF